MKKHLMVITLGLMSMAASANELYTGVGTTGISVGYGHAITSNTAARVEASVLDYSKDLATPDVTYDAQVKFTSVNAYYDYYPFSMGGLRLTMGISVGDNKVTGHAKPTNGTVNINGVDYDASGESVTMSAKMPTVRPYLGIGLGHNPTDKGFGFWADAGVLYGRAKVDLTASPGLTAAAGQSNIDAEKAKVQDEVNKYKLYPVLSVGFRYTFN